MDAELTVIERCKLDNLEHVIERGRQTFIEVGRALMGIRDDRLYRTTHDTFEAYCQERWGWTRQYANQLCRSAQAALNVQTANVADGDLETMVSIPESERVARPLTELPEADQPAAWAEAVETAPDGKVTAAHVSAVVERRLAEPDPEPTVPYITAAAGDDGEVVQAIADLAGRKFGCIYADPPWQYSNRATRSAVEEIYDGTMTPEEICAMPVAELAADDAHLHLWTTNAFLLDAFKAIEAWGFEYRSCFVWVKPQMGIGNYWRVSHEFMLLGIRGNAKRFNERKHKSWMELDRTRHSAKPEEVRGVIERVSPAPFLELFGRKRVAGWTVMGNQVEARLFA